MENESPRTMRKKRIETHQQKYSFIEETKDKISSFNGDNVDRNKSGSVKQRTIGANFGNSNHDLNSSFKKEIEQSN